MNRDEDDIVLMLQAYTPFEVPRRRATASMLLEYPVVEEATSRAEDATGSLCANCTN